MWSIKVYLILFEAITIAVVVDVVAVVADLIIYSWGPLMFL